MYHPRDTEYNIATSIAMAVAALEAGVVNDDTEEYMKELLSIDKHERVSRFHPHHGDLSEDVSEGVHPLGIEWGSGGALQLGEEGDTGQHST